MEIGKVLFQVISFMIFISVIFYVYLVNPIEACKRHSSFPHIFDGKTSLLGGSGAVQCHNGEIARWTTVLLTTTDKFGYEDVVSWVEYS